MSKYAVKGKYLKEFYDDNTVWPEGAYQDDVFMTDTLGQEIEDYTEVDNDIMVIIECGRIYTKDDKEPTGRELIDVLKEWMAGHHPVVFSGAEMDVIFKLVKFGPCYVGDLPSKSGAADLVGRGLVVYVCGPRGDESWYAATPELIPVFKELFGVQRLHSSN